MSSMRPDSAADHDGHSHAARERGALKASQVVNQLFAQLLWHGGTAAAGNFRLALHFQTLGMRYECGCYVAFLVVLATGFLLMRKYVFVSRTGGKAPGPQLLDRRVNLIARGYNF